VPPGVPKSAARNSWECNPQLLRIPPGFPESATRSSWEWHQTLLRVLPSAPETVARKFLRAPPWGLVWIPHEVARTWLEWSANTDLYVYIYIYIYIYYIGCKAHTCTSALVRPFWSCSNGTFESALSELFLGGSFANVLFGALNLLFWNFTIEFLFRTTLIDWYSEYIYIYIYILVIILKSKGWVINIITYYYIILEIYYIFVKIQKSMPGSLGKWQLLFRASSIHETTVF